MTESIGEGDLQRIVSLFEMSERASREDADEHSRNEAANAFVVLMRLLAKYGLSIGDIPELKRRHEQNEAAKAAKTASATPTQDDQPNVLELVQYVLKGFIDIQDHEFVGIGLWVLHTHVFGRFQISPRLALLSPTRGCGKSKALKLIEKLAANAERHDNISAAAIFRLIENAAPSLLLDEGDNLGLRIDRTLRAVLNSGHLKGGTITRVIRGEPRSFSTFAPAAIGAIGTLTLPLLHRSIVVQMHKTSRTDLKTVEMMASPEEITRLDGLRRLIISWAQSVIQFDPDPPLPKILRGRTADNWRVLIAIADSFGSAHWSEAARAAATVFADGYHDEDAAVSLLYDIRTIFRRLNVDRVKSAALAEMLNEMEDGVGIWSAWRGENDDQSPHAISQGEIAMLLRRFDRDLRPRTVFELGSRKERGSSGRGYYRQAFEKWWLRYCDPEVDEGAGTDNVRRLRSETE
jgi:hypothetical protein